MKQDIYEQCAGRWESILIAVGIEERVFTGKHQPCIYCEGTDRARWVKNSYYLCNQCGQHSPVHLIMNKLNLSFKETVFYIRDNLLGTTKMTTKQPDNTFNEELLKTVHKGLKKITLDDPVYKYLTSRGITKIPPSIYYNPSVETVIEQDYKKKKITTPAMVARFVTADNQTSTYSILRLDNDGNKARISPSRIFMPILRTMTGGCMRLATAGGILGICEGIETGLKIMQHEDIPVWAAGSAEMMKKIEIPDTVKHVIVFSDSDTSFTGQMAAYTLANRLRVQKNIELVEVALLTSTETDGIRIYFDRGLDQDFCDFYRPIVGDL